MVICENCSSTDVRVNNGNFARTKPEGAPAAKHTYDIRFFYCEQCTSQWETTAESQRDYYDYVALRERTKIILRDVPKSGIIDPAQHLEFDDLVRRTELAKKISTSYRHLLDLDPGEWHKIALDAA